MSQQTIKQQARRTAREMADKRRREREERERRVVDLAEQVMVAIGQRDAAVAETEKRSVGSQFISRLASVDLPHPDSPTKPTVSPSLMVSEKSITAGTSAARVQ